MHFSSLFRLFHVYFYVVLFAIKGIPEPKINNVKLKILHKYIDSVNIKNDHAKI